MTPADPRTPMPRRPPQLHIMPPLQPALQYPNAAVQGHWCWQAELKKRWLQFWQKVTEAAGANTSGLCASAALAGVFATVYSCGRAQRGACGWA